MKIISSDANASVIELSREEIGIINNALNEICHGVHIPDWEFATRMGCSRVEARNVLADIHGLA
jgi:hypothetical protein